MPESKSGQKGQVQINQRWLFGKKGDILFGDHIQSEMSEYVEEKVKVSEVEPPKTIVDEVKIAHIQGGDTFYEKNFTRMDFLKTAHKFGKGFVPVRKQVGRPAVRSHRKRPNLPPRFGTIGGGALTETEVVNEPGYKNDNYRHITPIKLGGGQIVLLESMQKQIEDTSELRNSGSKRMEGSEDPTDQKLQFKAPFVENILMKEKERILSMRGSSASRTDPSNPVPVETSQSFSPTIQPLTSRGEEVVSLNSESIRIEEHQPISASAVPNEEGLSSAQYFSDDSKSTKQRKKRGVRMWSKKGVNQSSVKRYD